MAPHFSRMHFVGGIAAAALRVVTRLSVLAVFRVVSKVVGYVPVFDHSRVTPESLTRALQSQSKLPATTSVTHIRWEDMECGAIGVVYRLHLTYSDAAAKGTAPDTMVIKIMGKGLRSFMMSCFLGVAEIEHAAWYHGRKIAADLMPDAYMTNISRYFAKGYIVMEDMAKYRSRSSRSGPATEREIEMIFHTVAPLHARTFGDAETLTKFTDVNSWIPHNYPKWSDKVMNGGMSDVIRHKCPRLLEVARSLTDPTTADRVHKWARGYGLNDGTKKVDYTTLALCHCDVRMDNAFFDDANGVCHLVDWQITRSKNPLTDLIWAFMDMSCEDIRDKRVLRRLLESYVCEVHKTNPSAAVSVEALEADMRTGVLYMVFLSLCVFGFVLTEKRKCPATGDADALAAYAKLVDPVIMTGYERLLRMEALVEAFV
eukprot:PhM_4_TR18018/c1_g1_i5/m.33482